MCELVLIEIEQVLYDPKVNQPFISALHYEIVTGTPHLQAYTWHGVRLLLDIGPWYTAATSQSNHFLYLSTLIKSIIDTTVIHTMHS